MDPSVFEPMHSYFFSTHRRYREGAKRFSDWLLKTAISCGWVPLDTSIKGFSEMFYPLLAKIIVRKWRFSEKKIPHWVIIILEDVIEGRRLFVAKGWLAVLGPTPNEPVKSSPHILRYSSRLKEFEETLRILNTGNVRKPSSTSNESQSRKPFILVDAFRNLQVHDKEDIDDSPSVGVSYSQDLRASSATWYRDQVKILFAVYCYLEDFHSIREWLRGKWISYKEGKVDLATVATITNTAFNVLIYAE